MIPIYVSEELRLVVCSENPDSEGKAFVEVMLHGCPVAHVDARVVQKAGADGAMYSVVELEYTKL